MIELYSRYTERIRSGGMKGAKWQRNYLGRYQQPLEILNG